MNQIISIDGLIGCGKSSLMGNIIANGINGKKVHHTFEPVDLWRNDSRYGGINVLDEYYSNSDKYGLAFQVYAAQTFLDVTKKELALMEPDSILIQDRCALSGLYQFMPMLDIPVYASESLKSMVETSLGSAKPSIFIYVKVSVGTAQKRVMKRNRSEELGIANDYQEKLKHNIELMMEAMIAKGIRVIVLDGEKSADEVYMDAVAALNNLEK